MNSITNQIENILSENQGRSCLVSALSIFTGLHDSL